VIPGEPTAAASTPGVAIDLAAWRCPPGTIGLTALGQAGVAIRSGDDLVLIDAFLSDRPERLIAPVVDPRAVSGVTAVLATHEHADHLDLPTWAILAETSPAARFVVPEPLVPLVTAVGIPRDRVVAARIGVAIALGSGRATAVPACHAVEIDDGYSLGDRDDPAPRFVGYVVELGGVRLYHAGDSLADDAIVGAVRRIGADIALLPINGRDAERERLGIVGNMTPEESARMALDCGAVLAIPIHFDTIRGNEGHPDAFVAAMRRHHPKASVWVPAPGASILWPAPLDT
jgi:L-ascorbate 6-phosphate lactonase